MSNLTNNTTELQAILAAVNALPEAGGEGITPTGTIEITENGTYDVTNYASAEVQVPSEEPVLQEKNDITPTESQQTITPDSGYDGLSKVIVNAIPDTYIVPSGTKEITANGSGIDVSGYAKVNVNVPTSGSGGVSAPTCAVTLYNVPTNATTYCTVTSGGTVTGEPVVADNHGQTIDLSVVRDTFVAIHCSSGFSITVDGEAFEFSSSDEFAVVAVNGDASITFS